MNRLPIVKRLVIGQVVILLGLLLVLVLTTVLFLNSTRQAIAPQLPSSAGDQVAQLRSAAAAGHVDSAISLAGIKGPDAVQAMRLVLEATDNSEVRMAMIQGLGPNNKDFDSVPLLIDIAVENTKDEDLRHMAVTAVEIILSPGGYYYAQDSWPQPEWNRDEWGKQMRQKWEKQKAEKDMNQKVEPGSGGKTK